MSDIHRRRRPSSWASINVKKKTKTKTNDTVTPVRKTIRLTVGEVANEVDIYLSFDFIGRISEIGRGFCATTMRTGGAFSTFPYVNFKASKNMPVVPPHPPYSPDF